MVGRIVGTLRRRVGESGERPLRPNELRRADVQATRRRRESPARDVTRDALALAAEERRSPRQAEVPDAAGRAARSRLAGLLGSRADLRRAWLMAEVFGPPRALRGREGDGFDR